ncbi:unnamed protein product, partial [Didymodactylos carnosus]
YNIVSQTLSQELNKVKLSIAEKETSFAGLGSNQEILQQELASVKQKIADIESASFDGTLMWKVAHVSEKRADAQSERQTSICSALFYSSPTGYKMRARLYLNGDGNAKRTHMSLFFAIVKGEYDAVLKWPFNHKVTFCLYDQSGQNRHIIDSFRPDIKSNSFQRPRSEINTASGIPKFFPLSTLLENGSSYVRDDTMFIKISVDFDELPKMVLPFALNLNPGLPAYVQQQIVKQELQRRQGEAADTITTNPIVS